MGPSPSTITNTITGGARPQHKRRGSIMSILRRKKDPESKVRKSDAESPARRDTPLERSSLERAVVKRQDSNMSAMSGTGKLSKRGTGTPQRVLSSGSIIPEAGQSGLEWPLPASGVGHVLDKDDRPNTADAVGEVTRPNMANRRVTATGLSAIDMASVTGTPKKKKKFGRLRRAFGLDE
jgi:serine/arginine repetitive matrix protein 2